MLQKDALVMRLLLEQVLALVSLVRKLAAEKGYRIGFALVFRVDGGWTRAVLSENIITAPNGKPLDDRQGVDALYSIYATVKALEALLQMRHTVRVETTSPLIARHGGGRYRHFPSLKLHVGVGISGLSEIEDIEIADQILDAIDEILNG